MTPTRFFTLLAQLTLAGGILLLGHYGLGSLAALLVLIPPAIHWWQQGRSNAALAAASMLAITGLSVVVLISLDRPPFGLSVFPVATQVALAAAYAAWLASWEWLRQRPELTLPLAGLNQALSASVIFLATAFWRWPEIVTVVLMFATSFGIAWWYLSVRGERAARILATTWGLIVAQISWVLAAWQVNYIIGGGYVVIPQMALISAGLGYCLASIHAAHADKRLSRRRLIEYVAIAAVLLAVVIAGTRWNGTV
jgi:hypothetical protein